MQKTMERVCAVCGAQFVGIKSAKYCGYECKKEATRRLAAVRPKKHEARISTAKQKSQSLTDIAKKAKEAGMHYGDYVAKYGL